MQNYVKQKHNQVAHQKIRKKAPNWSLSAAPSPLIRFRPAARLLTFQSGAGSLSVWRQNEIFVCLFFFTLSVPENVSVVYMLFPPQAVGWQRREQQIRIGLLGLNTSSRLSHLSTVSSIYRQTCFFCRLCVSVCFLFVFLQEKQETRHHAWKPAHSVPRIQPKRY